MRSFARTSLAVAIFVSLSSPAGATGDGGGNETTDVVQLYRSALAVMNALPVPPYARYTTTLSSSNANVSLIKKDGRVTFALALGGSTTNVTATTYYRRADAVAAVELPSGERGLSHGPLLNPTWAGADAWLRYGIHVPVATAAAPQATATGAPVVSASPGSATPDEPVAIGAVSVFSVLNYRLHDDGPSPCPGGAAGRAIGFEPYHDVDRHPLTGVTIDLATTRVCAMRFRVHGHGLLTYAGFVDLHFGDAPPYYVIAGGVIDIDARALIFHRNVTVAFARSDMTFPDTLPDATFMDAAAH